VTGESEPVAKQPGDYLYAGGRQMGGTIEVATVKPVSQSYLTSLWNHEAFRKDRQDDLQALTNRYSKRFTLIVVVVAVGAALGWALAGDSARGVKAFVSVLIVACPCALALAAPFTLGTAQRWLARINAFVRNALVIERMAEVDTIVFDKTGTLTSAQALGVNFQGAAAGQPAEELNDHEALWVRSLARHSTHPHSVRIAEALADDKAALAVDSFRETPGAGLAANVDGHGLVLGSRAWLERCGVSVPELTTQPGPAVLLAIDGHWRGVFTLDSTLRPEADRLVSRLAEHYELALLSGDNERERERFRNLFGSHASLHFNQSPLDKLGFIEHLQRAGKVVMMVGDGLNDAGALKQSDVGVAVVERVGAFSPASDVILEAARVPRLWRILVFARRSARVVRTAFVISALYNLVGIAIASSGLLSPVICAILMPVSSVSVVVFACGAASWAARRSGI
jgi:Cu+-exporting ATPase